MLVLTRKLTETLQIDNNITVTVLKIKGNKVRLGIEAPRHVRVVRGELPRFEDGSEVLEGDEESDLSAPSRDMVEAAALVFGEELTQTTTINLPKKG